MSGRSPSACCLCFVFFRLVVRIFKKGDSERFGSLPSDLIFPHSFSVMSVVSVFGSWYYSRYVSHFFAGGRVFAQKSLTLVSGILCVRLIFCCTKARYQPCFAWLLGTGIWRPRSLESWSTSFTYVTRPTGLFVHTICCFRDSSSAKCWLPDSSEEEAHSAPICCGKRVG